MGVAAVAALAVLGGAAGQAATAQRVAVDATEFSFALKPKTVKRGLVTFAVANRGGIRHDFRIAGRKTPVIAAGGKATLRITFAKAGRYAYLCTLPSHAAAGMRGVLVVR